MRKVIFQASLLLVLILTPACGARRDAAVQATLQAVSVQQTLQAESSGAAPSQPEGGQMNASSLPESKAILFQDDFQDGQPDGWKSSGGWFVNQDGDVYTYGSSGEGYSYVLNGGGWGDYLFRSTVRLESGALSLFFRMSKGGRYLVYYNADGLWVYKVTQGDPIELASAAAPSLGGWHSLVISGQGGHFQVYADLALVMDFSDPSPLPQGTIGYNAIAGTTAAVDDVLVSKLEGNLPAGEVVVSAPASSGGAPQSLPEASGAISPNMADAPESGGNQPVIEEPLPEGNLKVIFTVNGQPSVTVNPGECVNVEWRVENALEVYYQYIVAPLIGMQQSCPMDTRSYTHPLTVVLFDGTHREYIVTVNVVPHEGDPGGSGSGLPDLTIRRVDVSKNEVKTNQAVVFSIAIVNTGNSAAGPFVVSCQPEADRPAANSEQVFQVPGLAAIDETSLACNFPGYAETGDRTWSISVDDTGAVAEANEGNNTNTGEIKVVSSGISVDTDTPDLVPEITGFPQDLTVNQAFRVVYKVHNNGTARANTFTVRFFPVCGGPVGNSFDFVPLNAGANTGTLNIDPPPYTIAGIVRYCLIVDPDNEITESNENNNTQTGEINVQEASSGGGNNPPPQGKPNIDAVAAVEAPYHVDRNTPVKIKFEFMNAGAVATGPFNARWYSDRSSGIVSCNWEIGNLQPNQSKTVSCTFPGYPNAGPQTWMFILDPDNEVDEIFETDNTIVSETEVRP